MEIKIRKRPSATTGKTSLSLEYYLGYTQDENGKIKHKRKFETFEYFLYTPPKTAVEKNHNKTNLQMAEAVKAKRLLAFQNKQYGFTVDFKIRTNLVEYIRGLIEQRKESPGNWGNWDSALKHLIAYAGEDATFETVDKEFVTGFKKYLEKDARTKSNTRLSASSQSSYFLKLKAAPNQAVEDGIIPHSQAAPVKPAKIGDVHREYLTFEELQRLFQVDCKFPVLKQAFRFSCLTGLRWRDIQKLTWDEVQELDSKNTHCIPAKKDQRLEYLDISDQAVKYLGERGKPDEPSLVHESTFSHLYGLNYTRYLMQYLLFIVNILNSTTNFIPLCFYRRINLLNNSRRITSKYMEMKNVNFIMLTK